MRTNRIRMAILLAAVTIVSAAATSCGRVVGADFGGKTAQASGGTNSPPNSADNLGGLAGMSSGGTATGGAGDVRSAGGAGSLGGAPTGGAPSAAVGGHLNPTGGRPGGGASTGGTGGTLGAAGTGAGPNTESGGYAGSGGVAGSGGSGGAAEPPTAAITMIRVGQGSLLVQLGGRDYIAQTVGMIDARCVANAKSSRTIKMFQASAVAAGIAGKPVKISYTDCQSNHYIRTIGQIQ